MVQSPIPPISSNLTTELAECGWRTEFITQPNGTIAKTKVPLTANEFLHPQEGYRLPNSTFHDIIAGDAKDMLVRRYANHPDIAVFRDLLIEWDNSDLDDHCPDTFVVFGIQNKEQNRTKFIVANVGIRPAFIIEVVSPRYRKEDRETKVVEYARAGVQEYAIVDRRTYRGQVLDEVLGYRLVGGHYQPITPDDEGRILCDTVGLWLSLQNGCLVMEDAITGERLQTSVELEAAKNLAQQQAAQMEAAKNLAQQQAAQMEAAKNLAQQQAAQMETAKNLAQQQAAELEVLLVRYRERFGDLPDSNGGET